MVQMLPCFKWHNRPNTGALKAKSEGRDQVYVQHAVNTTILAQHTGNLVLETGNNLKLQDTKQVYNIHQNLSFHYPESNINYLGQIIQIKINDLNQDDYGCIHAVQGIVAPSLPNSLSMPNSTGSSFKLLQSLGENPCFTGFTHTLGPHCVKHTNTFIMNK